MSAIESRRMGNWEVLKGEQRPVRHRGDGRHRACCPVILKMVSVNLIVGTFVMV